MYKYNIKIIFQVGVFIPLPSHCPCVAKHHKISIFIFKHLILSIGGKPNNLCALGDVRDLTQIKILF